MKNIMAAITLVFLGGCASYVTPGRAAPLAEYSNDLQTREILERKPAAVFPARLAIVRVQDSGYVAYRESCHRVGRYSVVSARSDERDDHLKKILSWPLVTAVAPLNSMVIPDGARDGETALRRGAARVHADMLILYTFNTSFFIKDHEVGPLNTIALGFLPNQEARITTTASALVMDVRTGYIYGLAEFTASEKQRATVWTSEEATDACRVKAEAAALDGLVTEMTRTWNGIVATHVSTRSMP